MFEFSMTELRMFKSVCKGSSTARSVADSTGISLPTAYRTATRLQAKGLIAPLRTTGKLMVSALPHAASLKNFLLAADRPLESIVGPRLRLLLSISRCGKDAPRICLETGINPSSLRVYVWQLCSLGVVTVEKGRIRVSPTDHLMSSFLADYSKGVCQRILEEKARRGVMLWNGGLEFLFSATQLEDDEGVNPTGVTAMARLGLRFMSSTDFYHWSFWRAEPTVEQIALHTCLAEPGSPRDVAYSALLLHKAGYDRRSLRREASFLCVPGLARRLDGLLKGREYPNELMPSQRDLKELFLMYEADHA